LKTKKLFCLLFALRKHFNGFKTHLIAPLLKPCQ